MICCDVGSAEDVAAAWPACLAQCAWTLGFGRSFSCFGTLHLHGPVPTDYRVQEKWIAESYSSAAFIGQGNGQFEGEKKRKEKGFKN